MAKSIGFFCAAVMILASPTMTVAQENVGPGDPPAARPAGDLAADSGTNPDGSAEFPGSSNPAGLSFAAGLGLFGQWHQDSVFGTGFLPYTRTEAAVAAAFALGEDAALGFRLGGSVNTPQVGDAALYIPKTYAALALAATFRTGPFAAFAGAAWAEYLGTGIWFFYPELGARLSFQLPGQHDGLPWQQHPTGSVFVEVQAGFINLPGPSFGVVVGYEGRLPW